MPILNQSHSDLSFVAGCEGRVTLGMDFEYAVHHQSVVCGEQTLFLYFEALWSSATLQEDSNTCNHVIILESNCVLLSRKGPVLILWNDERFPQRVD